MRTYEKLRDADAVGERASAAPAQQLQGPAGMGGAAEWKEAVAIASVASCCTAASDGCFDALPMRLAAAVCALLLAGAVLSRSDVDGRSTMSWSDVMERVEGEEEPSGERISVSGVSDWDEIENVDCRLGDGNSSRSIA